MHQSILRSGLALYSGILFVVTIPNIVIEVTISEFGLISFAIKSSSNNIASPFSVLSLNLITSESSCRYYCSPSSIESYSQGCSQRGVQGVQLNPPPLQIKDIHDYSICLMEKLMADWNTCSFNE